MRSVADDLREDSRRRAAVLTAESRLLLALALGDADVAALCEARRITTEDAKALIARSRRVGRQVSRSHDG
ncbi:MAG TPA: hypothetical protein VF424_03100 [Vicinamibacterales bacterium]